MPAQWDAAAAGAAADAATGAAAAADADAARPAAELPWQQFVQDERLRQLIALALENNRDLRIARHSVEQMRAAYQISRANQFPTVGLNRPTSTTR